MCKLCENPKLFTRGYCVSCYERGRRNGTIKNIRMMNIPHCTVDGCKKKTHARGLCNSHYNLKYAKDRTRQYRYGVTEEMYDAMHRAQNGVCAASGLPETRKYRTGKVMTLCVDHDHKTGKVRGLLTHNCNLIIGLCDDNPQVLRNLADYLDRHAAH